MRNTTTDMQFELQLFGLIDFQLLYKNRLAGGNPQKKIWFWGFLTQNGLFL